MMMTMQSPSATTMSATAAPHPTSRSIPIHQSNRSRLRLRREEALDRESSMMADYVDYCFAQRLINGMQKKQSFTHDISLRYENQALIDHIIAIRQDRGSGSDDDYFGNSYHYNHHKSTNNDDYGNFVDFSDVFPSGSRRNQRYGIAQRNNSNDMLLRRNPSHGSASSPQQHNDSCHVEEDDSDEEMIFDMEL